MSGTSAKAHDEDPTACYLPAYTTDLSTCDRRLATFRAHGIDAITTCNSGSCADRCPCGCPGCRYCS